MWKKGEKYLCTGSKSNAYKVGKEYDCIINEKGNLCLRGGDGFLDDVKMLLSTFKRVKSE